MTDEPPPALAVPLRERRWPAVLGALLTVAMIVALGRELLGDGLAGLTRAVPRDPRFYLAFALLYLVPQGFDFLIFRRLWGVGRAGFAALTRKRIANDVLFGYAGEAYFYAWARARPELTAAPFAAVKDVTITSAIAGNAVTLAITALALPALRPLLSPATFTAVLTSLALVCATSLPFLLFRRRVFGLGASELWRMFGLHVVRIVAGAVLLALAWHYGLPGIGLPELLLLSAGRLLVSRLPFVPNKDLVFASFSLLLIRNNAALVQLIAFTAALTLLVHVALLAGFAAVAIVTRARRP